MRTLAVLLTCIALSGCALTSKSSDAAYLALADAEAHKSLDKLNRERVAKRLEPYQLESHGSLREDIVEGRHALVAFYDLDPVTPGGRFRVYVFKDNNEVKVVVGE